MTAARPRARRSARLAAFLTVLCLAVTGCASNDDAGSKPGAKGGEDTSSSSEGSTPAPSASTSVTSAPAADPGFGAPRAGQCTQLSYAGSLASVARSRRVACRRQHTSVVSYVGYLRRPVTPQTPVAQRRALGRRFCEPAYRKVVGGTLADRATSILTWTLFTPGQTELQRGARWLRCEVVARSGAVLIPLPATTPLLASGVPEQLRVCQSAAGRDISCSQPHAFRVESVYRAVGETYPAGARFTASARSRCEELTGKPGGFWQPPSPAGWRAGDRFVRCLSPGTTQP